MADIDETEPHAPLPQTVGELVARIDRWCERDSDEDRYPIEFICEVIRPALEAMLEKAPA